MINLNKRKKDIRKFITTIESSLIEFLDNYGILKLDHLKIELGFG